MASESERPLFEIDSAAFWLCEPRGTDEALVTTVSLARNGRKNNAYLTELSWELNEITHRKHLAKWLACSRLRINVSYYYYSKLQLQLHFLPNTLQKLLSCEVPIITGKEEKKKERRKQGPRCWVSWKRGDHSPVVCFPPIGLPLQNGCREGSKSKLTLNCAWELHVRLQDQRRNNNGSNFIVSSRSLGCLRILLWEKTREQINDAQIGFSKVMWIQNGNQDNRKLKLFFMVM